MGTIPDPLFDQISATTVAEFPGRKKVTRKAKAHKRLQPRASFKIAGKKRPRTK